MSEEAKQFVLGLQMSSHAKGMKWYGNIPPEIRELLGLGLDFNRGEVLGIYVEVMPRYEPYTPSWLEEE